MSNEAMIGFNCSKSRDWLQHVFPSCLRFPRSASINGTNMDKERLRLDEKADSAT